MVRKVVFARSWGLLAFCSILVVACGIKGPEQAADDDDNATTTNGSAATSGGGGATAAVTAASSTGTGNTSATTSSSGSSGNCGHAGDAEPAGLEGATAAHNAWRCAVSGTTALPPLEWSTTIAATAQSYADTLAGQGCGLTHSSGPYGENLFAGSGSYTPQQVIDAWMSEESCFTYTEFPGCCSCTCGHYTQVLWRATTKVGCGIGNCPGGGVVWVCNYDPPGNYLGQMVY